MDIIALLDRARSVRLTVSLSDTGEVKIRGNKTPSAMAVIEELRAHKPLIVSLLTSLASSTATDLAWAMIAEDDLTDFVGATVDIQTWTALQEECHRRYDGTWTLYADEVDGAYRVRRLTAK